MVGVRAMFHSDAAYNNGLQEKICSPFLKDVKASLSVSFLCLAMCSSFVAFEGSLEWGKLFRTSQAY